MKKINILIICSLTSILNSFAQPQVTLTFTAKMQDETGIALDSVKITNQSRSWTETIYYPDTILQMINSVGVQEAEASNFQLYQNTPNPFNGNTSVSLQIPSTENVIMSLYDIKGRRCALYNNVLDEGKHTFRVSVSTAQMYFLKVNTSQGSRSIKIFCNEGSDNDGIYYKSHLPEQTLKTQKALISELFISGDSMVYVGYATYDGEVRTQTLASVQNGNDETVCFEFELPEYLSICFSAGIGSDYKKIDSIKIVNINHLWVKAIQYPDTILQLMIISSENNSGYMFNNKIQFSDSLICIAYYSYQGGEKVETMVLHNLKNDTSVIFKIDTASTLKGTVIGIEQCTDEMIGYLIEVSFPAYIGNTVYYDGEHVNVVKSYFYSEQLFIGDVIEGSYIFLDNFRICNLLYPSFKVPEVMFYTLGKTNQ